MEVRDQNLTLQGVADILGVHYVTVYRYVTNGQLLATKVGGLWQVTRHDLDEFISSAAERKNRRHGLPDARRTGNYVVELERCLSNGDSAGAWMVLRRSMNAGASVEHVILEIVVPVMSTIGTRWANGEIDIAVEHQASAIMSKLIGRLSEQATRAGRHRGSVLIGGPTGERHALVLAMLSCLLSLQGWDVLDLGPDTPASAFVHAAQRMDRLVAVGVSVTSTESFPEVGATLSVLREKIGHDVPVILGGGAIQDAEHARKLGADHFAVGSRGFIDFLDGLTKESA
ncbi:hypothetical protein LBMAG12_02500 [Actinomycetes bacterium]|nr:hypothetical protein LBMAG12_02500 [Actinomycetes bacterium]